MNKLSGQGGFMPVVRALKPPPSVCQPILRG
jgi:hypothetical protein